MNSAPNPAPATRDEPLAWALALALVAAMFYAASSRPLRELDTWVHWKHGEWIAQHGRVPAADVFSPYSVRTPPALYCTWLYQVLGYQVYARWGMEGIALLYGLVEALKAALYLAAYRRASGSLFWAVVGAGLMVVGRWSYFGVFRPQALGELFWPIILYACARTPLPRSAPAVVPLTVLVWANVHGSFLLAFVLLGLTLGGQFLDAAWAARGLVKATEDPGVRRTALTLALAVAASCVNPFGPRLLAASLNFGKLDVLPLLLEWQALTPLAGYASWAFCLSVVAVLVTLRLSPRRFTVAEGVLLLLLGLQGWFTQRMIVWWMSAWPWALMPHWREMASAAWPQRGWFRAPRWAGVAVGVPAAAGLALASGSGQWLLRQQPRPVEQQYSEATPVRVAELLAHRLRGQEGAGLPPLRVFAHPFRLNDYLLWELYPEGRLYLYSFAHHYTRTNFADSNRLAYREDGPDGWLALVSRYRINALVVGTTDPPSPLFLYLEELAARQQAHGGRPVGEWDVVYRGPWGVRNEAGANQVIVAVRRADPFALSLQGASLGQGCVGACGTIPGADAWGFLGHLPWVGRAP